MIRLAILTALAVLVAMTTPAGATCQFKFQCSAWTRDKPKSVPIYKQRDWTRERVGSIYDPGNGKLQVLRRRDFTSEIILEIDKSTGTITRPRNFTSIPVGQIGP